ncbi:hypothetical protein NDU88_004003 [Pleurodeles waltl]|uniref:Uncharacterized protein n=1 Tax=Pleurodeles waltl TaxID=8319 RepID=A0AAV7L5G7_PLEWA|nr:hypothetical protein NDU88_004003 [Pleurodeles waltl]
MLCAVEVVPDCAGSWLTHEPICSCNKKEEEGLFSPHALGVPRLLSSRVSVPPLEMLETYVTLLEADMFLSPVLD